MLVRKNLVQVLYLPPVKHRFHVCVPEPSVQPSHGCGRGRGGSGHRRQVRSGHHRPGQDRGRDQAQPGDLGNTWVVAISGQQSIVVIHFNINNFGKLPVQSTKYKVYYLLLCKATVSAFREY